MSVNNDNNIAFKFIIHFWKLSKTNNRWFLNWKNYMAVIIYQLNFREE